MQLEAPPGQPVCKHSSTECVLWEGARASVPQQTPAGPPGCATWAGPSQPRSAPLSTGFGQGWGGWIAVHAEFHPWPHRVWDAWIFSAAR